MTDLGKLCGGGNIRRLGRPCRMKSQPWTFLARRAVSVGDSMAAESSVSAPWVMWASEMKMGEERNSGSGSARPRFHLGLGGSGEQ